MSIRSPRDSIIRHVIYGLAGAVLYGLLSWLTNTFPLIAFGSVVFRPAVALLIYWGVANGPWAGMLAGFIGSLLADTLSGWVHYWNWSFGYGLMGMIPGLMAVPPQDPPVRPNIPKSIVWGTFGILVGMSFVMLTEILIRGIDLNTALISYFGPAFLGNVASTAVFLPVLIVALPGIGPKQSR